MTTTSWGKRVGKITYTGEGNARRGLIGIPRDIMDAMKSMGAVYVAWELCANGDIRLHLVEKVGDVLPGDHGVSLEEWVKEA